MGNGLLNSQPMEMAVVHHNCDNRTPQKVPDLNLAIAEEQKQPQYEVYMRCVTWSRDSHGLFDYESKNIAKKNIKT
jgi:hypothetical protein